MSPVHNDDGGGGPTLPGVLVAHRNDLERALFCAKQRLIIAHQDYERAKVDVQILEQRIAAYTQSRCDEGGKP